MGDTGRLYMLVTQAILYAEAEPRPGRLRLPMSSEQRQWYAVTSRLEELIAREFPSSDLEGHIGRHGAVFAAMKSQEPIRALRLACRYLSDEIFAGFDSTAHHHLKSIQETRDQVLLEITAAEGWRPVRLTSRELLTP